MINSHLLYQLSYRGTTFQEMRMIWICLFLVKRFFRFISNTLVRYFGSTKAPSVEGINASF